MVSLAGLSAVYPGYQQSQGVDFQNRKTQLQNTDLETEQAGMAAFGNTLKMYAQQQQMVPGAQPMPQMSQGPQTPMPGQPSVSMRQPSQDPYNPSTYSPSQAQAPMGAPQQPMQPNIPQGGQNPMGGAPMQGDPMGQRQGNLDWRMIMGKVSEANPNAPPQVLASAVSKFLPLMTQQAQMEWKQVQLALMAQRVGQGEARLDLAGAESDRKQEQGDRRLGQGDQRIQGQLDAEGRRKEQGDRRLGQGDRRGDQADKRIDQSGSNFDRRENDRALDRILKQKKDALGAELQRERSAIFAAAAMVPPARLKIQLDDAKKRHDEAVARIEKEVGRPQAAQPRITSPAQPKPPKIGDIQDGHRFKGGDPAKVESWEKVGE